MRSNRRLRLRALVAILITATVVSLAAPVAANVPTRHVEGFSCMTDAAGHATALWHIPTAAPGVAVFQGQAPASVTSTDGLDTEVVGGNAYTRWFGGGGASFFTVQISGPPSTPCDVGVVLSEQPTNINVASAEAVAGRTGSVEGTTRAASVVAGAAQPVPSALNAVWYRWHGGDGPIDFTAIPHHTGTVLDDSDPFTSVGVAVFDVTDPSTPLAVGGDGVALPGGGTGGTASLQVSSTSEYLIAVFSAGGTGAQASQFGYTAAGAFTLSWIGPDSPPNAVADNVVTPDNTPVQFNVLANDSDPDGDPITFAVTQSLPAHGTLVDLDGAGSFLYTPDAGFHGNDTFDYEVSDDSGIHGTGTVTIDVGGTPAAPANDDFANAQPVGIGEFVYGTTVSSTLETGETEHHLSGSGQTNSGSVWYSFTPLVDGYVNAGVQSFFAGGSPNLYAHVYYAPNDPAAVDQLGDNPFFFAGVTYYVAVDSGADAPGAFRLVLEQHAVPSDNIANRVVVDQSQLGPNFVFGLFATHLATAEPNEPAHAGLPAVHSNWAELLPFSQPGTLSLTYSTFTQAPGVSNYQVDRNDNDGSLRLGVYTGDPTSFATLTSVPVAGTGPYTVHVDPGQSYFLAWDASGSATRYFNFGATFTPDPAVALARFSVHFEGGPPAATTGSACFHLEGPGTVTAQQCRTDDGELVFNNLVPGIYTAVADTAPNAYVLPASFDVAASGSRTAPVTVVVPKRRIEVRAGSPNTGPQPGLCYQLFIHTPFFDLPLGTFCDADDGASDGTATYGPLANEAVLDGTIYLLRVNTNPIVPTGEQEKVLGPFDHTTNPQVVNVTTLDDRAPVAVDDDVVAVSGTDTVLFPRGNDSDPDGDPVTFLSVSTPQHGTATIQDDTLIIAGIVIFPFGIRMHYTSDPTYSGPDSFTYTVQDNHGKTATATVNVTVQPGVRVFVSGADVVCMPPETSTSPFAILSGCQNLPVTLGVPPAGRRVEVTRAFIRSGGSTSSTINELLPPAPVTVVPSPGLNDLTLFAGGPAGWVHVTSVDVSTNAPLDGACFAARQNGATVAEKCTSALPGEYYLGPLPIGITEVVQTSAPPLYDPAPPATVDVPQNVDTGFTASGAGEFIVPHAPQVTMASTSFANDVDRDGVPNTSDNCSTVANPNQVDGDLDAIGDACDPIANLQSSLGPITISAPGNTDATVVPSPVPLITPVIPNGVVFPFGRLGFTIGNLHVGETVLARMQLPVAASGYWNLANNQWVPYPTSVGGPNQFVLTMKDGGPGDGDGVANGVIVAVGAPTFTLPAVGHQLRVSTNQSRTNPVPLIGATLTGKVAIFAPGDSAHVRSVDFSIDGAPYSSDTTAPFDLNGTNAAGKAILLSTRLLPDGAHTVTARITRASGLIETQTASFLTSNPRPATRELMVSSSSTRANAQLLNSATVSGSATVFVPNEPGLFSVEFYLDDPSMQPSHKVVRFSPMFDFFGTQSNGAAVLGSFTPGHHTMTVKMTFGDGYVDVRNAAFDVS